MKNCSYNGAMLRFISGIILVLAGIVLLGLYFCKVVPEGLMDSEIGAAIVTVWAFMGPVICAGISFSGLYLLGILE